MNKTVRKFISGFEKEFSPLLVQLTPINPEAEYTKYFEVFKARKKYSDWDLRCQLKPEAATAENIKKIERFIRTFEGFSDVGAFLSLRPEHKGLAQHIDTATWLQFMAFMPSEAFGPFTDIHIEGVNKKVLLETFEGNDSSELLKWAMTNYWRKIKNGDYEDAKGMLNGFILKSFPEQRTAIEADPVGFVRDKLKEYGCEKPVEFLEK